MLASAVPTRRGPSGVFATSGPPLSPEQMVAFTVRRFTFCLSLRIANPTLWPESQIAHGGSGQNRDATFVAVSTPICAFPTISGFRLPNPATESVAPGCV